MGVSGQLHALREEPPVFPYQYSPYLGFVLFIEVS
jgi:hypothetical protein